MLQCTGRTRIPTLGGGGPNAQPLTGIPTRSKLPLVTVNNAQQQSTSSLVVDGANSCHAAHALTEAHLGCLVRLDDDRVGVLRYLGTVRFAMGLWCGLELNGEQQLGKNDGQVNGVRYFKCPKQRGLMVPLSKVTLIQQDDNEESSSGPHSLLITNKEICNDTKTIISTEQEDTRTVIHSRDNTFKKSMELLTENQTYITDKSLKLVNVTYCNEDDAMLSNNQLNLTITEGYNEPVDDIETPPCGFQQFTPLTFITKNNQSTPITAHHRTLNIPQQQEQLPAATGCSNAAPYTTTVIDDPNNKRNSLEFEESLGILTPDQMDATIGSGLMPFSYGRSPSSENMIWFPKSSENGGLTLDNPRNSCGNNNTTSTSTDLSPSLGIIDENGLAAAFNLQSFTASGDHLSLSLDVQRLLHHDHATLSSKLLLFRADQTPSPEELPLDPTPVCVTIGLDDGEEVEEVGDVLGVGDGCSGKGGERKGAPPGGSFVASIISITSLDTGYQGDGEMSRPGSRGADNFSSPMTRRPQPRRNICDPMTDSDFYTESDADCHESDPQNQQPIHHHHRNSGDRHAQVIDGTLYAAADAHSSSSSHNGVGALPAGAAVYPDSGREPMDSSGVFTDLEGGVVDAFSMNLNRTIVAPSPSDSSTQTITDDSQQMQSLNHLVSGASSEMKSNSAKTIVKGSGDRSSGSERSHVSPKDGCRLISTAKMDDGGGKYKVGSSNAKKRALDSKVCKDATNINTRNIATSPSPVTQPVPKKQGKWDAVLNKIGKGSRSAEARSLKEVKSRVYSAANRSPVAGATNKVSLGDKGARTAIGSKLSASSAKGEVGGNAKTTGIKPRRILRTRATPSAAAAAAAAAAAKHSNVESSFNSSLSDLSGASPAKKHGSLKPQRVGSAKLSPRSLGGGAVTPSPPQQSPKRPPTAASATNNQQHPNQGNNNNIVNNNNNINNSKNPPALVSGKRDLLNQKTTPIALTNSRPAALLVADNDGTAANLLTDAVAKDNVAARQRPPTTQHLSNGRSANAVAVALVAASHQTNGVSPPTTPIARTLTSTTTARTTIVPQPNWNEAAAAANGRDAARAAEALAVLIQHLVFELDAFQAPILKKQVTVMQCDVDTARVTCHKLRETIREQTANFSVALDNERTKSKEASIYFMKSNADDLEKVTKQKEDLEHVVQTLKGQMQKLQQIHEEQLEILREENDAIRDQLDERNIEILTLKQQQQQHNNINIIERVDKTTDTEPMIIENANSTENDIGYIFHHDPDSQEVQSLRAVLDLKQSENSELRKTLAESVRKCDRLPSIEEKLSTRTARCEDLDLQLKLQREKEQQLHAEIKKLKDLFKDEANQKRRLSQYNEELQWKLKQSKEVITKVMEQTGGDEQQQHLNRAAGLNSSFSEKNYLNSYASSVSYSGTLSGSPRHPADRSNSLRERSNSNLSENSVINSCSSSPTSPKVKGVVTKSDSVSYVLDMEESSDVLASRIVRRSFRTNSSNSPLRINNDSTQQQQHGWGTPSPKQRSPSSNGNGRRGSSSVGNGSTDVGKRYLRSKSMTVPRTSESACSDSASNNTAVTEDEDDDDDDMGVFWQFNSDVLITNNEQKIRLLPSSTPCSHHEQSLRSGSFEPKHDPYKQQETDDSDEEQIQLPALPRQGTVLPPPRHLATDACNSEDDENSCSSSTSSADRL